DAEAYGVEQTLFGATEAGSFNNSGDFIVSANALATITDAATGTADAYATALGYGHFDDYPLDVNNSGLMDIDAVAGAADNAVAVAPGVDASGCVIGGSISSAGTIDVFASANGGGFDTVTVGTVEYVVATGDDYARALGIHLESGQNLATITN